MRQLPLLHKLKEKTKNHKLKLKTILLPKNLKQKLLKTKLLRLQNKLKLKIQQQMNPKLKIQPVLKLHQTPLKPQLSKIKQKGKQTIHKLNLNHK
jgi:hypothetical protein